MRTLQPKSYQQARQRRHCSFAAQRRCTATSSSLEAVRISICTWASGHRHPFECPDRLQLERLGNKAFCFVSRHKQNSEAKKEFETAENRALLRGDRPSTEIPQQASKHARRQGELCLLPPRARYWNRFHTVLAIKDQCAALRPQRTAGQGAFSIQAASKALRHLQ